MLANFEKDKFGELNYINGNGADKLAQMDKVLSPSGFEPQGALAALIAANTPSITMHSFQAPPQPGVQLSNAMHMAASQGYAVIVPTQLSVDTQGKGFDTIFTKDWAVLTMATSDQYMIVTAPDGLVNQWRRNAGGKTITSLAPSALTQSIAKKVSAAKMTAQPASTDVNWTPIVIGAVALVGVGSVVYYLSR